MLPHACRQKAVRLQSQDFLLYVWAMKCLKKSLRGSYAGGFPSGQPNQITRACFGRPYMNATLLQPGGCHGSSKLFQI